MLVGRPAIVVNSLRGEVGNGSRLTVPGLTCRRWCFFLSLSRSHSSRWWQRSAVVWCNGGGTKHSPERSQNRVKATRHLLRVTRCPTRSPHAPIPQRRGGFVFLPSCLTLVPLGALTITIRASTRDSNLATRYTWFPYLISAPVTVFIG